MDDPNRAQFYQMNQPKGEPLYTVDTHNTEKLYIKRTFLLNHTRLILLEACDILLLMWFAYRLNLGPYTLLFGLFLIFVFFLFACSTAKAAYKKQQRIQTGLTHYAFYEDCFTVQASFGQIMFRYNDLYQIRVRKNSICLVAAPSYCFALLSGEYPDGLPDFLRTRIPKRTSRLIQDALHTLLRVVFAAAAVFCFLVLLMVLRSFETDPLPPQESTPSPAESHIAAEPACTPEPTPTDPPTETATPEESTSIFGNDYIGSGYEAVYNAYVQDASNTIEYRMNAKGDGYYIVNETDEAVDILQYDRDSENGSCGLYVYKRCPKGSYGGWSPDNIQILNIYAYHYWDGVTAASGKTGWGDASALDYRELTGE